MIEINLIPDVKQELLKAQRIRASVITVSIFAGLIAIGVVVVLVLWIYGGQTVRGILLDNEIKSRSSQLAKVPDISNTLTIQNQLSKLSAMHDDKPVDSRIFDVLQAVNPPAPNAISVNDLTIDSTSNTITIDGQASNGFAALEVFKKTLSATTIRYTENGQTSSEPLVVKMSDGDRSYGQDANGARVLRFNLSFTYPNELFSYTVQSLSIVGPSTSNVTDSYLGVPNSLFVQKAADTQGGN